MNSEQDEAKPWDLLNNKNYTDESTRNGRYAICLDCDKLFKPTKTCKECGCFMSFKTWLKNASCPIGKWSSIPDEHIPDTHE